MTQISANALTIAGSDSGGGAGIQADIKTMSALGVFACSALTAITAQNTRDVTAIHAVPAPMVKAQLEAVLDDIEIGAIKIGMLGDSEIITQVANTLLAYQTIPVVLDPVMIAKSGDLLLPKSGVSAIKHQLFPLATLVTPNLPEAAEILGCTEAQSVDEMKQQAIAIQKLGAKNVLLKGGHLSSDVCVDILLTEQGVQRFEQTRITTLNTHGTGCTLSSAIAAFLATQHPLDSAVRSAIQYVYTAIKTADNLNVGHGHGPLNHFHQRW